jgi:hypothetical protein
MALYNLSYSIGCSFKFILKVDVEESIVNLSVCRVKTKHTKSEVRCKQIIRDL